MVDDRRVHILISPSQPLGPGPVVYWMNRDQRAQDNWALLFAQALATNKQQIGSDRGRASSKTTSRPLAVVFNLVDNFPNANFRHYAFMLRGLQETAQSLHKLNIPFLLTRGNPGTKLPRLLQRMRASALVTDFLPLRVKTQWIEDVSSAIHIPFYEVDAHNIVPVYEGSEKLEFAARTIRPRLSRQLPEFLTNFPRLARQQPAAVKKILDQPLPKTIATLAGDIDWGKLHTSLRVDRSVDELDWLTPGSAAALRVMRRFIHKSLPLFDKLANDPVSDVQSQLSPYLHFGHISAQRVALAVKQSKAPPEAEKVFLEQLIVRRELSDNFCYHCQDYDQLRSLPRWGLRTLMEHRRDPRPYRYTLEQLEQARTSDPLWNAAQREMVIRGKMHGYMRMYWAKKIVQWTSSPLQALKYTIYLNDKYFLDGRDPIGYVNILWSIGGLHDTPFPTRPIFGSIRYMSQEGCRRKFDVEAYIKRWSSSPVIQP